MINILNVFMNAHTVKLVVDSKELFTIYIARPAICKKNDLNFHRHMDCLEKKCKDERASIISQQVIAFLRQNADLYIAQPR